MLTFSSLMLFAWLFFVLRAWFDAGDEIRQHDAEMARVKRRTAAANAASGGPSLAPVATAPPLV